MNSLRPRNYAREIIRENRTRWIVAYLIICAVALAGAFYAYVTVE